LLAVWYYIRKKDYKKAKEILQNALKKNPDNEILKFKLSLIDGYLKTKK
jgi:uncharacterized protein HemY